MVFWGGLMAQIFISYKREERPAAKKLATALIAKGYDVWWDVELLPGEAFFEEIEAVIKKAKVTIVLWSNLSKQSKLVRAEASLADNQTSNQLISTSIDGALPPFPHNNQQAVMLMDWLKDEEQGAYEQLIKAIEKHIDEPLFSKQNEATVEAIISEEEDSWKMLWRAVRDIQPESASEYNRFLEKYRHRASPDIVALVERRIKHLKTAQPLAWLKSFILIATAVSGVVVGYIALNKTNTPNADQTTPHTKALITAPNKEMNETPLEENESYKLVSPFRFEATLFENRLLEFKGNFSRKNDITNLMVFLSEYSSTKYPERYFLVPISISDNLELASGEPNEEWSRNISSALDIISYMKEGKLFIENQSIVISGKIDNIEARKALNDRTKSLTYETATNISVPESEAANTGVIKSSSICQTIIDDLKSENKINFASNQSSIRGALSFDLLNNLAAAAKQCAGFNIRVEGHTDSDADEEHNLRLSEARANTVADYLHHNGISRSRLTAIGFGETRPIASNDQNDGKAMNRRIEFIVTSSN